MTRSHRIALCGIALTLMGPVSHANDPLEARGPVMRAVAADWLEAHTDKLTPAQIEVTAATLVEEAQRAGLAVKLVLAVIEVESGGDPGARSPAGAIGLMQLRPGTAAETARSLDLAWKGPSSLSDPVVNVRLGIAYLKKLLDRFGELPAALVAYNRGPARIARRLARGDALPTEYMRRIEGAFGLPVERGAGWL